jgi:hypothetical protein
MNLAEARDTEVGTPAPSWTFMDDFFAPGMNGLSERQGEALVDNLDKI